MKQRIIIKRGLPIILFILVAGLITGCDDDKNPADSGIRPEIVWQKSIGGPYCEEAFAITPTIDGGFVIAGMTTSFGNGNGDVYLVKVDSSGDTVWTRTFGTSNSEMGLDVVQTPDGGFAVAGTANQGATINNDYYLIKTYADGTLEWQKTYGDEYNQAFQALALTHDGGYVLVGFIASPEHLSSDVYVIKTNSAGDTVWSATYDGGSYNTDNGNDIIQLEDKGFLIVGDTDYGSNTERDLYVIRIDSLGKMKWEAKVDDGKGTNWAEQLVLNDDGSVATIGWGSYSGGEYDLYMAKIDDTGGAVWQKYHGSKNSDGGEAICRSDDGGYVITGFVGNVPPGTFTSCYIAKTDNAGNRIWSMTSGLGAGNCGSAVLQASDGSFIVAGYTDLPAEVEYQRDFYIAKVKEE